MRDVDVLVLPATKKPAQVLGYEHTPLGKLELSLTRPFNLTGNPSLAIYNGFAAPGLPLSIQPVGRHFEDDVVLRAGHAIGTPPRPEIAEATDSPRDDITGRAEFNASQSIPYIRARFLALHFTPFPIVPLRWFALNADHEQQHATDGGAGESVCHRAHDG
ncbi:MAG: amidase family protein [Aestuariivirga sp.]|nr:amidase family protein [Aestuariivirga sp.]